jgi:SAM-dependent methyltransferase
MKEIWRDLLDCQTELTLPLELPVYYRNSRWLSVHSVLDLGTGTGDYLKQLSLRFPTKQYIGVDKESEYIDFANRELNDVNTSLLFRCSDLFAIVGRFQCVIARLVAQHLPSLDDFLRHVAHLLEPGGIFLSIEPNDACRLFYPPADAIMDLYRRFEADRSAKGFFRDAGFRIRNISQDYGLVLESETDVIVPSTVPNNRELFVRFHKLIFKLFAEEFSLQSDSDLLQQELQTWTDNRASFAQVGIHFACYKKT